MKANQTAFQFLCMALAVNTIDGQSLGNEVTSKEEQGNVVFAVHFTVKGI